MTKENIIQFKNAWEQLYSGGHSMLPTVMKEKEDTNITCSDVKNIIKRFNNWKAPGPDEI